MRIQHVANRDAIASPFPSLRIGEMPEIVKIPLGMKRRIMKLMPTDSHALFSKKTSASQRQLSISQCHLRPAHRGLSRNHPDHVIHRSIKISESFSQIHQSTTFRIDHSAPCRKFLNGLTHGAITLQRTRVECA